MHLTGSDETVGEVPCFLAELDDEGQVLDPRHLIRIEGPAQKAELRVVVEHGPVPDERDFSQVVPRPNEPLTEYRLRLETPTCRTVAWGNCPPDRRQPCDSPALDLQSGRPIAGRSSRQPAIANQLRNLFGRKPKAPEVAKEERENLEHAVEKTREANFGRIASLFRQPVITDETWEELEELLIQADVGPATALALVEGARKEVDAGDLKTPVEAETAVRRQMVEVLGAEDQRLVEDASEGTVVLIVGVNGSGKTTSIAKLAHLLQRRDRTVLLAAADTFRAAAIDQLRIWAERTKAPLVAHQPDADPGAVVFDAIKAARARGAEIVLVDTAGRLHTKFNLMEELQKIRRVAQKADPDSPIISLLVLDATTGQNAILQAKNFLQAVDVDGIILAKLDGTAKGGVVFAVRKELGVPIWYIGTGEKMTDFAPFNHLEFVDALFDA